MPIVPPPSGTIYLQALVPRAHGAHALKLNLFAERFTGMDAILVAGIYGMNFEHMPELGWMYGYPMSLGIMVMIALSLFWWFRRKHWI